MNEQSFVLFMYCWIGMAILLLPIQLFITAPYGRHYSNRWGPRMDNRWGWIIMEAVSPLILAISFLTGSGDKPMITWIAFGLWMAHYINRTLIYPLRTRTAGKVIPMFIVGSAISFNGINGWSNGTYLGSTWASYPDTWLTDSRFIIGLAVFLIGAAINLWADHRLLNLRKPGEGGYVIPRGGLFERISCPNHFGEIIEWTGFAILCWNLPATAFAIWTAANLIPRAIAHHRWYKSRFADYPGARKALIPFLV